MPVSFDGRAGEITVAKVLEIRDAVRRAHAKKLTRAQVEKFGLEIPRKKTLHRFVDHPANWKRPPAEEVVIPHGFRCRISFEEHPQGLCRHLSVSIDSDTPHATAQRSAVLKIAGVFGLAGKTLAAWPEEYEPGKIALHMITLEPVLQ